MNVLALGDELAVGAGFAKSGEHSDCVCRRLNIRMQIKTAPVAPRMPGQHGSRRHLQRVAKDLPTSCKQCVKHPAHGEHSRPCVNQRSFCFNLPHLAAFAGGSVEHDHVKTGMSQVAGRSQAAGSSPDHDNTAAQSHAAAFRRAFRSGAVTARW